MRIQSKYVNLLICLCIFAECTIWNLYDQALHIYYLDVGQGDSALLRLPGGGKILIDTGPSSIVIKQLDSIIPFWDRSIDMIFLTHADADHIAGLYALLKTFRIRCIISTKALVDQNPELITLFKRYNIQYIDSLFSGDYIYYGNLSILYLWPKKECLKSDNSCSLALLIRYFGSSFLFTGDIEKPQETQIVTLLKGINLSILKVGHHGSKNSTSDELLATLKPIYCVISVGKYNTFGHPDKSTITNLSKYKCTIFRTDKNGIISFYIDHVSFKYSLSRIEE